jgi:hypothetical protein
MPDETFVLNQAHVQYQPGTGGSTVEEPGQTQTSIRLAATQLKRLSLDLEDMSLNPLCGRNSMH